jgi:hypothetical protein
MKIAVTVMVGALALWLMVSLLPFLLIGEQWGMLWMPLNCPFSAWVEHRFGIGVDSYFLIGGVTALNGVAYGSVAASIVWVSVRLWGKHTPNRPTPPAR